MSHSPSLAVMLCDTAASIPCGHWPQADALAADEEAMAFLAGLEGVFALDTYSFGVLKRRPGRRRLRSHEQCAAMASDEGGVRGLTAMQCGLDAAGAWEWALLKVTQLLETVTYVHRHVGAVSEYGQDVRFCAFAWPRGEEVGTRQTALRQAALTSFTSMAQPKLMVAPGSDGDWSQLWPAHLPNGEPLPPSARLQLQELFYNFQRGLAALDAKINLENAQAQSRPFPRNHTFNVVTPRYLDTSVSV